MKKIKFYKNLLIEIIETLCSICLFLESLGFRYYNSEGLSFRGHFKNLKHFSSILRSDGKGVFK